MEYVLMPEIGVYPLWQQQEDGLVNLDPEDFPGGGELRARILAWDEWYNEGYDPSDPGSGGIRDPEAFQVEGREILEALRTALEDGDTVTYYLDR